MALAAVIYALMGVLVETFAGTNLLPSPLLLSSFRVQICDT